MQLTPDNVSDDADKSKTNEQPRKVEKSKKMKKTEKKEKREAKTLEVEQTGKLVKPDKTKKVETAESRPDALETSETPEIRLEQSENVQEPVEVTDNSPKKLKKAEVAANEDETEKSEKAGEKPQEPDESEKSKTKEIEKPKKKKKSSKEADKSEKKPQKEKKKKVVDNHMDRSINKKITDYFTVRKSTRRCASDLEKLKKEEIENAIVNRLETGLEVRHIENKGRGVFATKHFDKNDFVVEYAGELISHAEAKKREHEYATDETIGCYMYYFEFKNKSYCVDATSEKIKRLGRLLNHSRTSANCHTKLIDMNGMPVLGIYASVDIEPGDELMYDYGDRNRDSVKAHPWLNS